MSARQLEPQERAEWDAEAEIDRCSRCGEFKPCQSEVDPFVKEGIDEGPWDPALWCFDCYEQRAMDV